MKKTVLVIFFAVFSLHCFAGLLSGREYNLTFYAVQTIYKNGEITSGGHPSSFTISGPWFTPRVNGRETIPLSNCPKFMEIAEQTESSSNYDGGQFLVTNDGYVLIYFNEEKGYANWFFYAFPGNPNTLVYRMYCSLDSSKAGTGASNSNSNNNNYYNSSNGSSKNGSSAGRTCPSCHGSGQGTEQVTYRPNYTGNQTSVYCSKCGRTTSPHTHHTPSCPVCHGRGTIK